MNFASNYAYINSKAKPKVPLLLEKEVEKDKSESGDSEELDLNVFVVTFEGVKNAQKQLSGGDPYSCQECGAILNKFSQLLWKENLEKGQLKMKLQLHQSEALWKCEFCGCNNILKLDKEEIPAKDDIVYMVESEAMGIKNQNDSTIIFCIDTSGSMNSTSAIQGKVQLKYGISPQQLQMLRQFMEPGDEAQLNYLPGVQNQNKTFVSRMQCILSAIESQINEIKSTYPFKKIGFVTFGSQVAALGDSKSQTVNIVGDKLYKKETIINSMANFNLSDPIVESYATLLNKISKIEAKGQTALGPALISALEIVQKGSPGSSLILCTDGLANIGVGQLEPYDEEKKKFYAELGLQAKSKNITVNIITIKGEGCKIEAVGQLAELTNGNIKIVNPQKISEDFANVLKDEVVGLNVLVKVLLHKGMRFRNEAPENISKEGCLMQKIIANATKNTRISFEYDVKKDEQLQQLKVDLNELKRVPFQAQIQYTSPTGGKFLRVISSVCDTTLQKQVMKKQANLGVVHQRITNQTAALYKKGNYKDSKDFNSKWADYLDKNFQESKFKLRQNKFMEKNERLNKAIRHRHRKSIEKKIELKEELEEDEIGMVMVHSDIESDEDQLELVDNLMERQQYSIERSVHSGSGSREKKKSLVKEQIQKKEIKRQRSIASSGSIASNKSYLSDEQQKPEEKKPAAKAPRRRHSRRKSNASNCSSKSKSEEKNIQKKKPKEQKEEKKRQRRSSLRKKEQ